MCGQEAYGVVRNWMQCIGLAKKWMHLVWPGSGCIMCGQEVDASCVARKWMHLVWPGSRCIMCVQEVYIGVARKCI